METLIDIYSPYGIHKSRFSKHEDHRALITLVVSIV